MLDRFLASVIHPIIQLGHGLEFGLPGLIAEGMPFPSFIGDIT